MEILGVSKFQAFDPQSINEQDREKLKFKENARPYYSRICPDRFVQILG